MLTYYCTSTNLYLPVPVNKVLSFLFYFFLPTARNEQEKADLLTLAHDFIEKNIKAAFHVF